jgi:putative DNA primase/helicase
LLTNNRPTASADDFALWKRIALIPFTQAFVDSPVEADEKKCDPELPEKLKLESSGILAWLVRGCLEWQKRGLKPPESVRMATQEYREEEDILTLFLDDCCKVKKGLIVKASALYRQYRWWAEGQGHTPWSNTTFGARMTKRFKKEKMMRGIFYQDVTLTEEI